MHLKIRCPNRERRNGGSTTSQTRTRPRSRARARFSAKGAKSLRCWHSNNIVNKTRESDTHPGNAGTCHSSTATHKDKRWVCTRTDSSTQSRLHILVVTVYVCIRVSRAGYFSRRWHWAALGSIGHACCVSGRVRPRERWADGLCPAAAPSWRAPTWPAARPGVGARKALGRRRFSRRAPLGLPGARY